MYKMWEEVDNWILNDRGVIRLLTQVKRVTTCYSYIQSLLKEMLWIFLNVNADYSPMMILLNMGCIACTMSRYGD